MSFPLESKIDSTLAVEVHLHEFFLGDRMRQCWTYLTRGMKKHGQRELALSILVNDGENVDDVPKTPLKMFQLLGERTAGRQVEHGDSTKMGQKGIFGFPSLYYVPAIQYEGLPNVDDYLALILVHREEYAYIRQYGLTRFLSRLGKFCSSFPYPTWNTQARPSLFTTEFSENSILATSANGSLDHSCVHQLGSVVQLQLHKSDAEVALTCLKADPDGTILNTAFSPRCSASLFWQESQEQPGAYAAPTSGTRMIGGSFLEIRQSQRSNTAIVEDGFSIQLSAIQYRELIEALDQGNACEFELTGSQRFVIDFIDVSARPRARSYQASATWQQLGNTDSPARIVDADAEVVAEPVIAEDEASIATVLMDDFVNLSGENSLTERVNRNAMLAYLDRIHSALNQALSEEQNRFSFNIELTIYPDSVDSKFDSSHELNPAFVAFIQDLVKKIQRARFHHKSRSAFHSVLMSK